MHELGTSLHPIGDKTLHVWKFATYAHDMELSITNRRTKDFLVPEVKKDKKKTRDIKNIMERTTKESMVVNTTPL